jgi:hypothetical protein
MDMTQHQKNGSILIILGFLIPAILIKVIFALYNDTSQDFLKSIDLYLISIGSLFLRYDDYSIPG